MVTGQTPLRRDPSVFSKWKLSEGVETWGVVSVIGSSERLLFRSRCQLSLETFSKTEFVQWEKLLVSSGRRVSSAISCLSTVLCPLQTHTLHWSTALDRS